VIPYRSHGYLPIIYIELVRHNMVVFSNGDQALQVLPGLVDTIPEARLNLVIYHLRHAAVQESFELIRDIEPSTPQVSDWGMVVSCLFFWSII
jgi:hypothetical protein